MERRKVDSMIENVVKAFTVDLGKTVPGIFNFRRLGAVAGAVAPGVLFYALGGFSDQAEDVRVVGAVILNIATYPLAFIGASIGYCVGGQLDELAGDKSGLYSRIKTCAKQDH